MQLLSSLTLLPVECLRHDRACRSRLRTCLTKPRRVYDHLNGIRFSVFIEIDKAHTRYYTASLVFNFLPTRSGLVCVGDIVSAIDVLKSRACETEE